MFVKESAFVDAFPRWEWRWPGGGAAAGGLRVDMAEDSLALHAPSALNTTAAAIHLRTPLRHSARSAKHPLQLQFPP